MCLAPSCPIKIVFESDEMIHRLVMFDIDGTILKTKVEDFFFETSICKWLSIKSIDTNWTSYEHVTDAGIAAELYRRIKGHEPSKKELYHFSEIFFEKWKSRLDVDPTACVPTAGVEIFLSRLRTLTNISMAIATGGWKKTAKLKFDHCRMHISDVAMATCDDSHSREEIMETAYERACQKAGVSGFERSVYFGDGEWDFEAAKHLGFDFIGINNSNRRDAILKSGGKYVFDDFTNDKRFIDLICNS
jgi:phosphoglycolate phosphatase-like HAD superfamily hydrolase